MKISAIALAALVAACTIGTAQATATRSVYQEIVSYGDLNLASEADAAILHDRIASAARKVCGLSYGLIPMEIKSRLQACVQDATARAVADVNSPTLSRLGQLVVAAN